MTLRPVSFGDLELVCDHRRRMFEAAGRDRATLERMTGAFRPWLASRLRSGEYGGWVVENDGEAVASVGLMFIDWPPHPEHPDCDRRGYVLNLFVEPDHRRRGLAARLMDRVEAEARARGVHYLILHPTAQARPIYETMNWQATSEMSLRLS